MEQQQQQQPEQQRPIRIEQVAYKYGTFELRIIGDPNRLLDVPIAYFTSRLFTPNSAGSKQSRADKQFKLADQEPQADQNQ